VGDVAVKAFVVNVSAVTTTVVVMLAAVGVVT
jgi:hypothetical protein